MDEAKKIRYDYIDIIKIIAIAMVIFLHSVTLKFNFMETEDAKTYISFMIRILSEGVPIFVAVNGFLIINKKFELKKHLKKTGKIFIVFIIWCIIDTLVIKTINSEDLNIKVLIKNVLITDISNVYTGPLWFLQNLIMLYFIFPILKVVHDNNKKIYNYLFIIVSFFTVGMNLLQNITVLLINTTNLEMNLLYSFIQKFNPISNGSFIFFFMLGGYIFENKEKFDIKKNRIISILIGLVCIVSTFCFGIIISKISNKMVTGAFNYCTIFTVGIIGAIFAVLYNYKNKNHLYNKLLMDIGNNSLGIYLVHKIIVVICNKYITEIQTPIYKIALPLIILMVSYIIVKIIQRIPIIRKCVEL